MRFLPEGPSIPDELIEERDRGHVVFFCGAGVSLSAGMPTFAGLCKHVIQELGAPSTAQSRILLAFHDDTTAHPAALPAFDQIFNVLQQEYRAGEIDYQITRRLKPKRNTSLAAHETVLRLSKSVEGKHQVVTTNFDYLFEKAAVRRLNRFVPPALPELASGQPLNGLVYLHGRINGRMRRGDGRQGFVISSSDFGRAYLADGWATRFVRDLLDQYTVVLLGYSANDPPVRYLLQGLHSRKRGGQQSIYAFDKGSQEEVRQRWQDSGVIPLAYVKTDEEHSALWNTLNAWAEQADDPTAWRQKLVDLAEKGPRALTPEERGQVASILRTEIGANLFADADPPPPGEWLCVLDSRIRYGEASSEFDPLATFGLDDDLPRPPNSASLNSQDDVERGDDLLCLRAPENKVLSQTRLAGVPSQWADRLSPRLFHLSRWIGSVAHEAVVAWWAAKYKTLHPGLLNQIEYRVRHSPGDFPEAARDTWIRLIDIYLTTLGEELDTSWYQTKIRIGSEGWTSSVLRAFERATQPYLTVRNSYGLARIKPPGVDWSEPNTSAIVEFEVKFPRRGPADNLNVPDDAVPHVYRILRGHLEWAAGVLFELNPVWWRTSTFYPENSPDEEPYIDETSAYLFWFRSHLDHLIKCDPDLVRHDSELWPKEERFFFDKLRLYIWSLPRFMSGEDVAERLLAISGEAFWDYYKQRELLMMLKARWIDFPEGSRSAIENRIADGAPLRQGKEDNDSARLRAIRSAVMLGWLLREGCSVTSATRQRLGELRKADPNWSSKWDEDAASANEGGGGIVQTITDPSSIIQLPLDQIVPMALKESKDPLGELRSYRPFIGLLAERPARAVASLTYAGRLGEYPTELWRSALQNWPEDVSGRLTRLFAERLVRLPQKLVVDLRFDLFGWAEKNLPSIARSDLDGAIQILDALLDNLLENAAGVTKSSLGTMSVGGQTIERSRRTLAHAINSPVGDAAQLLLSVLSDTKPDKGSGMAAPIRTRMERLVMSPGEGQDHAVCVITQKIDYLHYVDPDWTSGTVLPWFNVNHRLAEPAWNGFLYRANLPEPGLFLQIKSNFLAMVSRVSQWIWDEQLIERAHKLLIQGCLWHKHGQEYVSFDETRMAMQATNDAGRVHCLGFLTRVVRYDNKRWPKFGRPFLEKAWPREREFQTESTSKQFWRLAQTAGAEFPDVVNTVFPFLGPVSRLYSMGNLLETDKNEEVSGLATKYPEHSLTLLHALVPDDPIQPPYQLAVALELIGNARPNLRQDPRWRRLNQIASGG